MVALLLLLLLLLFVCSFCTRGRKYYDEIHVQ